MIYMFIFTCRYKKALTFVTCIFTELNKCSWKSQLPAYAVQTVHENKTKSKFILTFINFLTCSVFLWFISACMKRAWNSSPSTPSGHLIYRVERCISKTNIVINWICVYVCGPTVDCLRRCPKSNTPISRINRPQFSIPRSPEMKLSFFSPHNHHLRQSIARELDLSQHNPLRSDLIKRGLESPLSHGNCSERQENVHHWGADQKRLRFSRRQQPPHSAFVL